MSKREKKVSVLSPPPTPRLPEIINYYTKMPKELLDTPKNPNQHLHNLSLPFRMCIVAPSGSGKTNFLINLLHLFSCGDEGSFQSIFIITKNKDEPLYKWVESKCDRIVIKEGLHNTPPLDKFDKDANHLVVWDDLVLSKDLSMVENYYIRARKLNVSVIFISQSYFRIPKIIRNNCSYLILLKLSGDREVNMILSENGLGVDKEQLLHMYQFATREKFSPLVIDMEADPASRFRKGLNEVLNAKEF
jgi:hypothetical protein